MHIFLFLLISFVIVASSPIQGMKSNSKYSDKQITYTNMHEYPLEEVSNATNVIVQKDSADFDEESLKKIHSFTQDKTISTVPQYLNFLQENKLFCTSSIEYANSKTRIENLAKDSPSDCITFLNNNIKRQRSRQLIKFLLTSSDTDSPISEKEISQAEEAISNNYPIVKKEKSDTEISQDKLRKKIVDHVINNEPIELTTNEDYHITNEILMFVFCANKIMNESNGSSNITDIIEKYDKDLPSYTTTLQDAAYVLSRIWKNRTQQFIKGLTGQINIQFKEEYPNMLDNNNYVFDVLYDVYKAKQLLNSVIEEKRPVISQLRCAQENHADKYRSYRNKSYFFSFMVFGLGLGLRCFSAAYLTAYTIATFGGLGITTAYFLNSQHWDSYYQSFSARAKYYQEILNDPSRVYLRTPF